MRSYPQNLQAQAWYLSNSAKFSSHPTQMSQHNLATTCAVRFSNSKLPHNSIQHQSHKKSGQNSALGFRKIQGTMNKTRRHPQDIVIVHMPVKSIMGPSHVTIHTGFCIIQVEMVTTPNLSTCYNPYKYLL